MEPRRALILAPSLIAEVDWFAHLHRDATLLGVASHAGTDTARVPTCPAWDVGVLLRHVGIRPLPGGADHRRTPKPPPDAGETTAPPGDPYAWYQHGRTALFAARANADPSESCWTFLGPNPLDWCLRRPAHETAVHRVDAELARGRGAIDPLFAADGVDEHLETYLPVVAARRLPADNVTVTLRATDVDLVRTATVTVDGEVTVTPTEEAAAARVRASAVDLYLWLWHRAPTAAVDVEGDATAVDGLRMARPGVTSQA